MKWAPILDLFDFKAIFGGGEAMPGAVYSTSSAGSISLNDSLAAY